MDFVNDRANVDLCDTHMQTSSAVEYYCLLMGIKDPDANINAISSQLCPRVVDDLKEAAASCQDVPDAPTTQAASGHRNGQIISQRAECQVRYANGLTGAKLRERVQQNTALQLIQSKEFLQLLPQNFSSLRVLSNRMAKGVFSPDKELSRVGLAARPSGFSVSSNPTPAGTTLQVRGRVKLCMQKSRGNQD